MSDRLVQFASAALATVALVAVSSVVFTDSAFAQKKQANVQCMTDDGYGRLRSCSQGYMAANPNWRGGDACFTDDGYGRFRSCSQGYKAKNKK